MEVEPRTSLEDQKVKVPPFPGRVTGGAKDEVVVPADPPLEEGSEQQQHWSLSQQPVEFTCELLSLLYM